MSTTLIDDKKEQEQRPQAEPETQDNVEKDVDEAVDQLDDDKKEEEQKAANDNDASSENNDSNQNTRANNPPVLTALSQIDFIDTSRDDSFSTNSTNADSNDADSDRLRYSINDMSADLSRRGFTHSTDGSFGKLYINQFTGAYAFVPDDDAIEGLKSDTSEEFTLTVSDGSDTDQEALTIAVTGVNDTPILTALSGVLIEDTASDDTFSRTNASLDASDRDRNESFTYTLKDSVVTTSITFACGSQTCSSSHAKTGSYGTLYIDDSTGAYTYVPNDDAIEGLTNTASEEFELTVTDASGASASRNLSVEVKGANDTPVLASLSGLSFEDTAADNSFSASSDTLSATDRDNGQNFTYSASDMTADTSVDGFTHAVAGDYGTLYLNSSNGDYRYVPDDDAIEALTSAASEDFTLTVSDGSATASQTLTASITGANDTPVLSISGSYSFTDTAGDDSLSAANLIVTSSDRDNDDLSFSVADMTADTSVVGFTHAVAGDYGTLYINSNTGANRYIPDDDAIEAAKTTQTEDFILIASDGTATASATISNTIIGTNDTPTLASLSAISLTDTAGDDSFAASSDALAATDRDDSSFTYSASDMTADTSVDGFTHAVAGDYGTLYLNSSNGDYRYVPDDDAIEALTSAASEDFTLTVSDGSATASQTLTASITGANDTPTMTSLGDLTITDTAANDSFSATTEALISADDRDTGQSLSYGITSGSADTSLNGYTHSLAGDYGKLYLNATSGAYTYVPDDSTVNSLTGTETDTFTLSASDGSATTTQTLTATVNGVNDTPSLASISAISITDTSADDSFAATTASLNGDDRDTGQSLTYSLASASADTSQDGYTHSLAGSYGTLYIEASTGDYTYIPNDSVIEGLSSGSVTDQFDLTVSDGTLSADQTLTVNVTGTNDTPELAAISGIAFTDTSDNTRFNLTEGQFDGSDRDRSANLAYTIDGSSVAQSENYSHVIETSYGLLYYDETTGNYQFRPNDGQVNAAIANVSEDITVNVTDGTTSSSQNLTISVAGVDDKPVITADTIGDQNTSAEGFRVDVTDAESHEIHDISSSLPAWLSFRSSTTGGGDVQYYWEIGADNPAWLNGTANVDLQASANGLLSDTRRATFVFRCSSDLCDNFIQSSDALTPRQVTDSSDQLNELKIDGETFEYFKTDDINDLFNASRENTGQFRVVYTADEANGGDGLWTIDQTVIADYQKREITVNGTIDVENLTYFDDASDSFTYSNLIDFSSGGSTYQTGLYHETSYSNSDDFSGYEMVNKDGETVNLFIHDYVGYLNDQNGNNASVIYSTIQTLSSNPAGYNENYRDLVEEEWRVLEPQ